MDQYVDYEYYKSAYKGKSIPEADFDRLAMQASFFINSTNLCCGKVPDPMPDDYQFADELKRATCAVAETIQKHENNNGKRSESVGKLSVTYVDQSKKEQDAESAESAKIYLSEAGLLYRGLK